MKILVIGGEGYIGQVLVTDLVKAGHFVRSFDLLIYGQEANRGNKNKTNYEFIKGDINDQEKMHNCMQDIDAVILLAGLVGDSITKKYPRESKLINETGIKATVNLCIKNKINRLIFVSTCSNYGFYNKQKLANEQSRLKPLSSYAKSKVLCEKYILSKKKNRFCPTILRFATAFGYSPRMRFDLTINEFIMNLLFKKKLFVYDPYTWRPYCHVKDFSRLIRVILSKDEKKISYKVFNVGSKKNNHTKKQIVEIILRILRLSEKKIKYQLYGPDPRNYRVDFSKIQKKLNFYTKYSIEYGIKEIINQLTKKNLKKLLSKKHNFGNYKIKKFKYD